MVLVTAKHHSPYDVSVLEGLPRTGSLLHFWSFVMLGESPTEVTYPCVGAMFVHEISIHRVSTATGEVGKGVQYPSCEC